VLVLSIVVVHCSRLVFVRFFAVVITLLSEGTYAKEGVPVSCCDSCSARSAPSVAVFCQPVTSRARPLWGGACDRAWPPPRALHAGLVR